MKFLIQWWLTSLWLKKFQSVPEKAKTSPGGPWTFCGLLPLFDPPRHDSAETIRRALSLGICVKMITGMWYLVELCEIDYIFLDCRFSGSGILVFVYNLIISMWYFIDLSLNHNVRLINILVPAHSCSFFLEGRIRKIFAH